MKKHKKAPEWPGRFAMINITRWFFALLLVLSAAALALAQVDPTKVLVGTWEGLIEIPRGSDRVLIINSVKAKGEGEWVARGRFGTRDYTSSGKGGQAMDVTAKDNEILVEFVTKEKNPVRLKLVNENRLEGTINIISPAGKAVNRRASFEKVDPKAGDIK
jgi:hypothetical protein